MARKVVCRICRSAGDTSTFYKVSDSKGVNRYYCNKEEYDAYINEKKKRENLIKYIFEHVFNYSEGQVVPPVLIKKIQELNKFYDYDVILETFKENSENIKYWLSVKDFSSEFGMVSYVMKIIESNINDIYKVWKQKLDQEIKQKIRPTMGINLIGDLYERKIVHDPNDGIMSFLDEEDL